MHKNQRKLRLLAWLFILACLSGRDIVLAGSAAAAPAAQLIVNTLADGGDGVCDAQECTLREAVAQANRDAALDTIVFYVSGTVLLQSPLNLSSAIDIAAVAGPVTLDGGDHTRILNVEPSALVELRDLRLTRGQPVVEGGCGCLLLPGGAIFNQGYLTLRNVEIDHSRASLGAGIYSERGALVLDHTIVRDNQLAGIPAGATPRYAVGVVNLGGTLALTDSTVTRNTFIDAQGAAAGNGVFSSGQTIINQSTIAGNNGIEVLLFGDANSVLLLLHSTLVDTDASPLPTLLAYGDLTLDHTLVGWTGQAAGTDLEVRSGALISRGYNALGRMELDQSEFPALLAGPGDQYAVGDLHLGALQDNGGHELTMLPLAASVALNAGDPATPLSTVDQRGAVRVQGGRIDIGAAESALRSFRVAPVQAVETGASGTTPLTVLVELSAPQPVTTTVQVATLDASAQAGADYLPLNTTLTFAPGVVTQPLTLQILADAQQEPDEELLLTLSSTAFGPASYAPGVITLLDDDHPLLTLSDAAAEEGAPLVFTATLDQASALTATVHYQLQAASAQPGLDYVAASGWLTFAPGQTTQTLTVTTLDDPAFEQPEAVLVALAAPHYARVERSSATGIITDAQARHRVLLPLLRR